MRFKTTNLFTLFIDKQLLTSFPRRICNFKSISG